MNFHRVTLENGHADTVTGRIWNYPPRRIALIVNHPLEQWVFLDSNRMLLYYPKEKKAFRFQGKGEFSMPFFQAFIGAKEGKAALSEMGFTLKQNQEKGDTLYSLWEPPQKSRKLVGLAKVGVVQNRLVVSEVDDPNGNALVKSFFRSYQVIKGVSFPMEIEIQSNSKGRVAVEKNRFENLQPNSLLPPEIRDFQIPAGVQIKEIEW